MSTFERTWGAIYEASKADGFRNSDNPGCSRVDFAVRGHMMRPKNELKFIISQKSSNDKEAISNHNHILPVFFRFQSECSYEQNGAAGRHGRGAG